MGLRPWKGAPTAQMEAALLSDLMMMAFRSSSPTLLCRGSQDKAAKWSRSLNNAMSECMI